MDLFQKLKELDFPFGEYVVVGGSLMARGIREERDLDILVSPTLYRTLFHTQGYTQCTCSNCMETSRLLLKGDGVDILPNFLFGSYTPDTYSLIRNAEVINGFPFIQFEEYVRFKTELYSLVKKEKYINDVKLMEEYSQKRKNNPHA